MQFQAHPRSGKPAPAGMLAHIPRLVAAYYTGRPDPSVAGERVAFGTSGHRGQAYKDSFNEAHTKHAPWYILRSDDRRRARLNCITHLLTGVWTDQYHDGHNT